jgi:hypothetical protein
MGESIMNPNDRGDDLVEQAIQAMLNTAGTDQPPAEVVNQVRRTIAGRQTAGLVNRPASDTHRDRVSWLALAMTLLLMVTTGWIVGFHQRLLSEVAGQQLAADGQQYVFYTDGHVEVARLNTQ